MRANRRKAAAELLRKLAERDPDGISVDASVIKQLCEEARG